MYSVFTSPSRLRPLPSTSLTIHCSFMILNTWHCTVSASDSVAKCTSSKRNAIVRHNLPSSRHLVPPHHVLHSVRFSRLSYGPSHYYCDTNGKVRCAKHIIILLCIFHIQFRFCPLFLCGNSAHQQYILRRIHFKPLPKVMMQFILQTAL
jgi:hypothetical protein